jgi:hypothetical protein
MSTRSLRAELLLSKLRCGSQSIAKRGALLCYSVIVALLSNALPLQAVDLTPGEHLLAETLVVDATAGNRIAGKAAFTAYESAVSRR